MLKFIATVLLVLPAMLVRAQDDNYVEPCTFTAHTAVGTVTGTCETQEAPLPGYYFRWTLTLQFDAASMTLASQLKPDQFDDMVRTQSTEQGTDIIVLGLWGDVECVYTHQTYVNRLIASSPLYETRPTLITISQPSDSPLTLQLLFEEPEYYLNLVARRPSFEWWARYLDSYYRLGTNRPTGFSSDAEQEEPAAKQPTRSRSKIRLPIDRKLTGN